MSRPNNETRLQAFCDGEMTRAEQDAFAAELERSPELRARLATLRAAGRLAQQSSLPEMPAGLEERIMARTQLARAPQLRTTLGFLTGGTVSTLLLALLLLPVFSPTGEHRGSASEGERPLPDSVAIDATPDDDWSPPAPSSPSSTRARFKRSSPPPGAIPMADSAPEPGVMSKAAVDSAYGSTLPGGDHAGSMEESAGGRWTVLRPRPAETLQAGEVDDNEQYGKYLAYLRDEAPRRQGLAPMDETARLVIQTVDDQGRAVPNVPVTVHRNRTAGQSVQLRTDAGGTAFYFPMEARPTVWVSGPSNWVQGVNFDQGVTQTVRVLVRQAPDPTAMPVTLRLAFVIDTTGSMGEEIDRVRDGIDWIAARLNQLPRQPKLELALVLFRDKGDAYVTKAFDFTPQVETFRGWLNQVTADGGGDTPEAVEESLATMIEKLNWDDATVRLAFLIGDAPPQLGRPNVPSHLESARKAAAKGIKIEAVSSSGNEDVGEYVWRQLALLTGGKFLFVTKGGAAGSTPHHVERQDYSVQNLPELILDLISRELAMIGKPPREFAPVTIPPRDEPQPEPVVELPPPPAPPRAPFRPQPWLASAALLLNLLGWTYAWRRSREPR